MSLSGKTKRWLTTSIKIVISVVLLCVIYSKIEVEETMTVLKTANLLYIFIALVIFIIINGFLLVRWGIFIKALGLKASWVNIARHLGIGLFGNLFMPSAIGGDVIKTVGLCSASSQKPKVVATRMQLKPGMKVVEVGPGKGNYTKAVAEKILPDGKVYAIDIQESVIDQLRKKIEKEKISNIIPMIDDAYNLSFEDESINRIFSIT